MRIIFKIQRTVLFYCTNRATGKACLLQKINWRRIKCEYGAEIANTCHYQEMSDR